MDQLREMCSRCRCCCTPRTAILIITSFELVTLVVVAGLLITAIALTPHSYGDHYVFLTALSFILVNTVLTCILIYGINKKCVEIMRGWLWVRVSTLVIVILLVILGEIVVGRHVFHHVVILTTVLGPCVVPLITAVMVGIYIKKITAEARMNGHEMDSSDYGRLQEERTVE
ncbi:hypothetical protein OTU49_014899 [Cherax quadricarinatus]|uniref:Uncharacterized protein n=1 Tax=Cherax quadricarinatus TaxID=27406 RepID=A0AAW0YGF9_CHEQU